MYEVFMLAIGLILFILPYFVFIVFINKEFKNKFIINTFITVYSFIIFYLIFILQDNRTILDIISHIINPSLKFFIKYYITILIILSLVFFIAKNTNDKNKKNNYFSHIFIAISIFVFFSTSWGIKYLPLNETGNMYYNLKIGILSSIPKEMIKSALLESILPFMLSFIMYLIIFNVIKIYKYSFNFKYISINISTLITIILFILTGLFFIIKVKLWEYPIHIYKDLQKPIYSKFYEKNFIDPNNVEINFFQKKRNCIFIMLESMESSFADYKNNGLIADNLIPNLSYLANKNINFSETEKLGGGETLFGTGWTIAAFVSKMAGLPYNLKGIGANPNTKTFLPKATTLNDILYKNDYTQVFIFGSDKRFASRDSFLESHGNVIVKDLNYYKEMEKLDKNYHVFWGFEDLKLYEYAKEELINLANNSQPFFLGLLTVDTHFPEGYQCTNCKNIYTKKIHNIISCADEQIFNFVQWIQQQDFYKDTCIIITGDHLFMTSENDILFDNLENDVIIYNNNHNVIGTKETKRKWINIFINTKKPIKEKFRKFSSFDIFPTTLEAMGATIEGDSLAFGVSLFSDKQTLLEKYDKSFIDCELMKKTTQYEYLIK